MTNKKDLIHHEERQRWHLANVDEDKIRDLATKLSVDPIISKMILARNIGEGNADKALSFLFPPDSLITDTTQMSSPEHIQKALTRIQHALAVREHILINGDPDADGITGTTILVAGLRELGCTVSYEFPVRPIEGHGIQPRIIDKAKEEGIKLIITTDCGTKDIVATNYANSLGIDIIICDHHILGRKLPESLAVINPYIVEQPTLFQGLSGASMALKLIIAVYDHLGESIPESLFNFLLSLAALGTISDRMTLKNPMNRAIVNKGVECIAVTKKAGLKALRTISTNFSNMKLKPRDISRTIVPRLNAPGRIGNPYENIPDSTLVVDLLLLGTGKKNKKKATELIQKFSHVLDLQQEMRRKDPAIDEAEVIENVNEKRKFITSKIEDEIDKLILTQVNEDKDKIIIVKGMNWNSGVIGIDTDRLKERFLRPAMILTEYENNPYIRGSIRSIPTINMYKIIDKVADDFEETNNRALFRIEVKSQLGTRKVNAFGGHSQACGFTIHKDDLDEFTTSVRAGMETLPTEQFDFSHEILETISFSDLTQEFLRKLETGEPYGQHFEYPTFLMKNCILNKPRPFGNKYQNTSTPHVEFRVSPASQDKNKHIQSVVAVGFSLWDKYGRLVSNEAGSTYDIIFSIDHLIKRNKKSFNKLQLFVQDIRKSV
jgi:single-stranded-DNA-specific exonuclease